MNNCASQTSVKSVTDGQVSASYRRVVVGSETDRARRNHAGTRHGVCSRHRCNASRSLLQHQLRTGRGCSISLTRASHQAIKPNHRTTHHQAAEIIVHATSKCHVRSNLTSRRIAQWRNHLPPKPATILANEYTTQIRRNQSEAGSISPACDRLR